MRSEYGAANANANDDANADANANANDANANANANDANANANLAARAHAGMEGIVDQMRKGLMLSDGGGVIFHCGAEPMWGHLGPLRSRLKLGRGSGGARARFRAGPPCNVRGLGSR